MGAEDLYPMWDHMKKFNIEKHYPEEWTDSTGTLRLTCICGNELPCIKEKLINKFSETKTNPDEKKKVRKSKRSR